MPYCVLGVFPSLSFVASVGTCSINATRPTIAEYVLNQLKKKTDPSYFHLLI